MTTWHTPSSVLASTQYDTSTYSAAKVADGSTSTRWASGGAMAPQWLLYDLGSVKTIDTYTLTPGNYSPTQNPTGWTLEGSTGAVIAPTFTASSTFSGFPASNVGDGSTATRWAAAVTSVPQWLQADCGGSTTVGSYSITPGGSSADQNPTAWTLAGSDDGSTWTTVDTQSAQTFATGGTEKSYTFTPASYRYWRLTITANAGGYTSISELRLWAPWTTIDTQSAQTFATQSTTKTYTPASSSARLLRLTLSGWTDRASLSEWTVGGTDIVSGALAGTNPRAKGTLAGIIPVLGALAGTNPKAHGTLNSTLPVIGTLAGTNPRAAGSLAGTSINAGTLSGTNPKARGSLNGTIPVVGTLAGVNPRPAGSLPGIIPVLGTLAGTNPRATGSLAGYASSDVLGTLAGTNPRATGSLPGLVADLPVPPWTTPTTPASPSPATLPVVAAGTAAATLYRHSPQILAADFTVDPITGEMVRTGAIEEISGTVGTLHVTVDGVDVTVWNGRPVLVGSWERSQPNGDASAVLTITQQDPQGTPPAWLHAGAVVEVYLLRPDTTRVSKFLGRLEREALDVRSVGRDGTWSRQWTAAGILTAAMQVTHQPPTVLLPTDIGTLVAEALNRVPGRLWHDVPAVTTGILSQRRGSSADKVWTYVQALLADAWTADGRQWTIRQDGQDVTLVLKQATGPGAAVDATVHVQTPGVDVQVARDDSERVTVIYGHGVTPEGYYWAGTVFPGFEDWVPPDYPWASAARNMHVGDTDADTDTGDGVTQWETRAAYLGYAVTIDGIYTAADAAACRHLQAALGILVDGIVGPQTWNATWSDPGEIDLTSFRRPLAWVPAADPWLYDAAGKVLGANPDFDPQSAPWRDVDRDYGPDTTRAMGAAFAADELARWSAPAALRGTIELAADPRETSKWEIDPGANILLEGVDGLDVIVQAVTVAASPQDGAGRVRVTVDERARDALTLAGIMARDRGALVDPAARARGVNRGNRSNSTGDQLPEVDIDSPCGRIPRHALNGGLWTVTPTPWQGGASRIALIQATTDGPAAEFLFGVFTEPITSNSCRALVRPGTDTPWDANLALLRDVYGLVGAWGGSDMPGYWPGTKGTDAVTGRYEDSSGVDVTWSTRGTLWVARWSPVDTHLQMRLWPAPRGL